MVEAVGGNGSGFSRPSSPLLGLPKIWLSWIRSAYVPLRMNPLPHGIDAVVEFAGVVKLSLFATTLRRKIVQRAMRVEGKVGVSEVFFPELHAPSCGGGVSSLFSEFGPTPFELLRKIEFCTTIRPPEFVPE